MTDPTNLVTLLRTHHRGSDNAISAADLVEALGLTSDRELRDIVHAARHELQEPVCSLADKGYFYPLGPDDDELQHSIAQMRKFGIRSLENAVAMEDAVAVRWPCERLFECG